MIVELERGFINSEEDASIAIQVVGKISVKELKKIGDDEAIGSLLVEFVYKMTSTDEKEGVMIDKELVDMISTEFSDDDWFMIGYNDNGPAIGVMQPDGKMAIIKKEEAVVEN